MTHLSDLFHDRIDARRYHASEPVRGPRIGQAVVVPVWQDGEVIDYRQGSILMKTGSPGERFYVVDVPGIGPVGYYGYSLAAVPRG